MAISRDNILHLAEKCDSFYVYDSEKIKENISKLKDNFDGVKFLYSVKTNNFAPVAKLVIECGLGIDAASLNEVLIGKENGLGIYDIQYSAPAKLPKDIRSAVGKATVIADSLHEIDVLDAVGREKKEKLKIGVRINPNFTIDSDKGSGGKFGIDEDIFFDNLPEILKKENIEIIGIHVHSRSQELDHDILKHYYENMLKLCERAEKSMGKKLQFVNMGGGLGIPYAESDNPLDIKSLGKETGDLIKSFRDSLGGIAVYIESGRFIVGNAGTYVTKVVDKKISHGKTYVLLHNTFNGFARPSFAVMAEGFSSGVPKGYEPIYTKPGAFRFITLNDSKETEVVTLAGNLCTSADTVAKDINLPKMEIGDIIAMTNAGSYAYVLSPVQFASQQPPRQVLLK